MEIGIVFILISKPKQLLFSEENYSFLSVLKCYNLNPLTVSFASQIWSASFSFGVNLYL